MDMSLLLSMMGIFVLFGVIMFFMFKSLVHSRLVGQTEHLDAQEAALAKKKEDIDKQLEDIKRQSREILANAQKEAAEQKEKTAKEIEGQKTKILDAAHQEANEMIKQADNARLALMAEENTKIDEKATLKAVALLKDTLPENVRRDIHEHWISGLIANSYENLDRLKVPEGTKDVTVICAFELTGKQRNALMVKLNEKLGNDLKIKEETDPDLIAGLVVNIGSLFLDGSLRFKIKEESLGHHQTG
ncbi:MAG: F0F1 ATP synthase subunit delta [Candidatus Omnitrophica bacterium]|nr:F0F1 ATP synthase subunit delta [Candidatus Omnitrophota bacterium]